MRKPLGIAIVGGLMLSQILTLYTTPVVYLYWRNAADVRPDSTGSSQAAGNIDGQPGLSSRNPERSPKRADKHNMDSASACIEPILSLIYVSTATRELSEEDLLAILKVSRRNNTRDRITGMLLYKDGNFMQVLEGPEAAVHARFAIIGKDPQHKGVLLLVDKKQTKRDFGEWSMGFHNLMEMTDEDKESFRPYLPGSILDVEFQRMPSKSYKLLRSFKSRM